MSAPQSIINICSGVRLDPRYEHSIYFANATDQANYFAGKVVKTFSAYSYLRKSWPIKVQATMEEAKRWNYLYFRNTGSGKTYYYFITNIEYINDSTVELSLELDVLQTYLFDMTLLPCFVERQHTTTDEIGEHTVEEGLDVGELTVNGTNNVDPGKLCIMLMCSTNPNATTEEQAVPALPYMYNRVFSGVKIWAINPERWASWGNQMETLDEIGKTESIVAMWMYPMTLVALPDGVTWDNEDLVLPVEGARSQDNSSLVYQIPTNKVTLDGYTPKNKKLFCYPYNFAYCTDNNGNSAVYRYERFEDYMEFKLSGSLSPDGGVHLTPVNYNGLEMNYHEGMTLTGYPTCAWNSDIYKLWLAQNQGQQLHGFASAGLKILGGTALVIGGASATATGAGAVPGVAGIGTGIATASSGIKQIADLLAQRHDKEIVPPQAKGNFSTSVNITNNMLAFTFHYKSVTAETARILDDYFTMYGYRLNRVQTPNINARPSFTYVKTIDCHIKGNMCTDDIVKIETIFDKGITFWKNGDKIADYTQDNTV